MFNERVGLADGKYLPGTKVRLLRTQKPADVDSIVSASLPKISKALAARTPRGQFAENAEQRSRVSSKLKRPSRFDENTRYIASRSGLY